jgi:Holliday junction resolvase RusA-like endonuclease
VEGIVKLKRKKLIEYKIVINSPPQAQGRPRFVIRGRRGFAFDPHKDKKNWYRLQISEYIPKIITTPINIKITFYMPIPKSTSKKKQELMAHNKIKHQKKPDLDNMLKFVLDSMNDIVFRDDSQIWHIECLKKYSRDPRVEIIVRQEESEGSA